MKSRRQSKGKAIRPTFFVFCEGESEEAYVKYLRSKYRLPIEICPSVAGLGITRESIARFKKGKPVAAKDRVFLMYDLDRDDILNRLKAIKGATIIASNPCLELWYLLHYVDQKAEIASLQCLAALKRHLPKYMGLAGPTGQQAGDFRNGRRRCPQALPVPQSSRPAH